MSLSFSLSELIPPGAVVFLGSLATLPDLRFLSETELNFLTGFFPAFVVSSPLELSLELEELDESELELDELFEDELPEVDELKIKGQIVIDDLAVEVFG